MDEIIHKYHKHEFMDRKKAEHCNVFYFTFALISIIYIQRVSEALVNV